MPRQWVPLLLVIWSGNFICLWSDTWTLILPHPLKNDSVTLFQMRRFSSCYCHKGSRPAVQRLLTGQSSFAATDFERRLRNCHSCPSSQRAHTSTWTEDGVSAAAVCHCGTRSNMRQTLPDHPVQHRMQSSFQWVHRVSLDDTFQLKWPRY